MGATYFFRDNHTLRMLPSHVIPFILKERGDYGDINIWSAGCANGSEPYTIALILKETLDADIFNRTNIYATDIDPNFRFREIVSRGSYHGDAVKKIPVETFQRYFTKDPEVPGNYLISDNIREHVMYMWHDLNSMNPPVNKEFDIIICKNVLLHFRKEDSIDIIRMFYRTLRREGFLITEQTQKIPSGMEGMFRQFIGSVQIHRKISPLFAVEEKTDSEKYSL